MGLAELEEWGMGGHDAFGNRLKVEELPDPPVMYEVYLEDGKAEGGRWYWGQEKGMMDDGIWSNKRVSLHSPRAVTIAGCVIRIHLTLLSAR